MYSCVHVYLILGFSIRTESSEVKKLMEQKTEPELKVKEVYARFQSLVRVEM